MPQCEIRERRVFLIFIVYGPLNHILYRTSERMIQCLTEWPVGVSGHQWQANQAQNCIQLGVGLRCQAIPANSNISFDFLVDWTTVLDRTANQLTADAQACVRFQKVRQFTGRDTIRKSLQQFRDSGVWSFRNVLLKCRHLFPRQ